ncbi:hypothetical protein DM860_010154 [Cuscuta australis]|uniref:Uncharacterized protein n=1 Tax=Cuscuta australis TaxID=267555 RepID=A0A328D868_9ASTE|nr:hypothetical protein DM860_010154 [Cuscuta australis]
MGRRREFGKFIDLGIGMANSGEGMLEGEDLRKCQKSSCVTAIGGIGRHSPASGDLKCQRSSKVRIHS